LYSYDGFGSLTSKVATQGAAPQVYPQVNSATNQARMIGDNGFDANGNWLGASVNQTNIWNVENQSIPNGSVNSSGDVPTYTYDPCCCREMDDARVAPNPGPDDASRILVAAEQPARKSTPRFSPPLGFRRMGSSPAGHSSAGEWWGESRSD
jgi:hypothetical protein